MYKYSRSSINGQLCLSSEWATQMRAGLLTKSLRKWKVWLPVAAGLAGSRAPPPEMRLHLCPMQAYGTRRIL
jgi:hypothetical protein